MASVSTDSKGFRRVLFTDGDGTRRTIRLGKVSAKAASAFCHRVESILAATIAGRAIDPDDAAWLDSLPKMMHDRVARTTLVPERPEVEVVTLGALLDKWVATIREAVKGGTLTTYMQAVDGLREHFGAERSIVSISSLDCEEWRAAMSKSGLASATVSKRVKTARMIFGAAVEWDLLTKSPLSRIKCGAMRNPERNQFIDRETISRVMDAAPNDEWRLLIALSRFGGLRVPSEALALTWADIDWQRARMRVRSTKTEHQGRSDRLVPIFPELHGLLMSVFESAEPGAVNVIASHREGYNPNPQLRRIVERAGLTAWPRLWHNLRASRATELAAQFPAHVAAAWLGHTDAIADKHYRMVREEDFAKAAQNPTQHTTEGDSNEVKPTDANPDESRTLQLEWASCSFPHKALMTPRGFEPRFPG